MRLIKTIGLVALMAIAATTLLVGVSAATEEEGTVLCSKHEDPCQVENLVSSVHFVNTLGSSIVLLDGTGEVRPDITCLAFLFTAEVQTPEESLTLFANLIAFTKCGNNAEHINCVLIMEEMEEQPRLSLSLSRTALNLGTATVTSGLARLKCLGPGEIINIDCTYDLEGMEFSITGALHEGESSGNGMITATEVPIASGEGSGPCPKEATLDFLLEPLDPFYIVS